MAKQPDNWRKRPLSDAQRALILDLQRHNGFDTTRPQWELVYGRQVEELQGNAGPLIDYLKEVDAFRRCRGKHYSDLIESGCKSRDDVELRNALRVRYWMNREGDNTTD